ncbi:MAG: SUMF1/EgtB/PvdO family nonheme iron enzyme [Cyanobacteria bacterium P01_A01_bin.45]
MRVSKTKSAIATALNQCRIKTLEILDNLDQKTFCTQVHDDFSPLGWHLGHIAYTESLWLLERSAGLAPSYPEYRQLFAADGLPKFQRKNLPSPIEVRGYLDTVRDRVIDYLEVADIERQERLWYFVIQHECQHYETINFLLHIIASKHLYSIGSQLLHSSSPTPLVSKPIKIPAGEFLMGNSSLHAVDNEAPVHIVYLDTFYIDPYPVTCGEYRYFIEAGGYEQPQYWCNSGWKWLKISGVKQPLFWQDDPIWSDHPVYGVNWYEANAYCRFVGKRLPTEAEWEKAASWNQEAKVQYIYPWGTELPTSEHCNHNGNIGETTPVNHYHKGTSYYGLYDTLGNVWEWTSTYFNGYENFQPYPYRGYSQVYFDHQHLVLKGGSWATSNYVLRCSTRNWYHPNIRQILAGFRCAMDGGKRVRLEEGG